jgi:phage regulator Rha-like protein
MKQVTAQQVIEEKIFVIRGQKVMIDRDLAELYQVETKYLNRQVKSNIERFPKEFMFQLTIEEKNELVQNLHRFKSLKHSTYMPYAFTEHGVAMLASVLRSERAVAISIYIVKTFIKLREILTTHKELAMKIDMLEEKLSKHDIDIMKIFQAIRQLMAPTEPPKRRIGFHT